MNGTYEILDYEFFNEVTGQNQKGKIVIYYNRAGVQYTVEEFYSVADLMEGYEPK